MSTLRDRIERLSAGKQAWLRRRLGDQTTTGAQGAATSASAVGRVKRLVAYVVPHPVAPTDDPHAQSASEPPDAADLRTHLKDRLPDYMIPSAFVLLDELPRTPNGKVDRQALLESDGDEALHGTPCTPPRNDVEKTLVGIWAEVLGLEEVGINDNFFEIGGDSILSIQIVSRCRQADLVLAPNHLFEHQTIAELAEVVGQSVERRVSTGPITGPVPLTPIQHWFLNEVRTDLNHWNQALWLELPPPSDAEAIAQVLQHLVAHHDALRLRWLPRGSRWSQENAEVLTAFPLQHWDVSGRPEEAQDTEAERLAAQLQAQIDLSEGLLLRAAYCKRGPASGDRLLLIVHHLAVDGLSWQILLEDLDTLLAQQAKHQPLQLPDKTTSFQSWSQALVTLANSDLLTADLNYWLNEAISTGASLPTDFTTSTPQTEASAVIEAVSLSRRDTERLLREVPAAYNTHLNDLLLTALMQSFIDWTGSHTLTIGLEGHGREDIIDDTDLSRTVGWLTSFFPVTLHLSEDAQPGQAIMSIKEQLRRIPHRGLSYGMLRYLHSDAGVPQRLAAHPAPQIVFNYLGQQDQLTPRSSHYRVVNAPTGPARSDRCRRSHLLEVNAMVKRGRLQIEWTYSREIHRAETIKKLAEGYLATLGALIAHCVSPEAGGYTPSDFPDADLDQGQLDAFLKRIT